MDETEARAVNQYVLHHFGVEPPEDGPPAPAEPSEDEMLDAYMRTHFPQAEADG